MYARSDNFYFLHFFSTWCVIMKGTCVCVSADFDLPPSSLYAGISVEHTATWLYMYVCMRCPILVSFSVTFPLQEAWQGHYFLWHGFCSQELRTEAPAVRFKLLFRLSRIYLSFLSSSFLLPPPPLFSFLLPFLSPRLSLSSSQPFHWRSDSSKWADANSTKLCPQSQHQHHFHLQGNVIAHSYSNGKSQRKAELGEDLTEYCDKYWIAAARMVCIYLSRLFSQMIAITTR